MKGSRRLWTFRVILWSVFFFLLYLALDVWKATGMFTLEQTLSRVLKGKVEIEGLSLEPPLGIHVVRFQVDSVLLVREAHVQWFPVFRIRRGEVLSVYVDLDSWIPRFWGPPSLEPPRPPKLPLLAVDRLYVNEARVRTGGMVYRASGLSGRLAMGGNRMEVPFTFRTLDLPFRGRLFNVLGIYALDYPENRPRHRVESLEAAGLDTLGGLSLEVQGEQIRFKGARLFLHDVGDFKDFSGTYDIQTRRLSARVASVTLPTGESLEGLAASVAFAPDFRRLTILSGQGTLVGRARISALQGTVELVPPYAFRVRGVADSVWQDSLWFSGTFRVRGASHPPYTFAFTGLRGSIGPIPVDSVHLQGVVFPPRIRLDTLFLRAPWGDVTFQGTVDTAGPTGEASLHLQDLPGLVRTLWGQEVTRGEGVVQVALTGWDHVQAEGFFQDLTYRDFRFQTLKVGVRRNRDTLEVDFRGAVLAYGDSLLLDSLSLYALLLPDAPGSWSLSMDRGDVHLGIAGVVEGAWPSLELRARDVEARPFRVVAPRFEGVITDERVSLLLSGVTPFVHLTGEVVYREGLYWLDTQVEDFNLATLSPFFQRPLAGLFSGEVHLVGQGPQQEVTGSGGGARVVFESIRADSYRVAFHYRRPALILDSLILLDPGGRIEVRGQILAEPPNYLNLTVHLEGGGTLIANELLKDLFIAEGIQGYGTLELRGPAATPSLSGEVAFVGRDVLLVGTGTSLDSAAALVRTRGDTLRITELWGLAQGGILEGKGWTRIENLEPRETRMDLRIVRFPVEPGPLVYARLSGPLVVEGVLPVLWVRGNLRMDEAYVDARFSKLGGPQRAVEPSPLRLDLHLSAPDGVFLTNELADVELSADLTVYKPDDINMYLQGNLQALSGTFLYLDRRFDITGGEVRFQNDPTFNPELFLEARTEVDIYSVYLTLTGRLQEPLFALRSEPPLDTLSILSLLTLGTTRPTDLRQVAELSYLQSRVFTLAGALLASRLRREVGLRELTWRSATGELVVGALIGRNLFIRTWGDPRDFLSFSTRMEYYLTRNRRSSVYFERSGVGRVSFGLQYEWEF